MTSHQSMDLNSRRAIMVAVSLIGFVSCGVQVPLGYAEEVVLKPPKLVLTPPATKVETGESAGAPVKKSEFFLKPNAPSEPSAPVVPAVTSPRVVNPGSAVAPVVVSPATPAPAKKTPAVLVGMVSFSGQGSRLPASAASVLLPVVSRMRAQPLARLSLRGYSPVFSDRKNQVTLEPTTSDYYRQSLSQAMAVRDWLVAAGIDTGRIDLEPKGQGGRRSSQEPLNRVEVMIQGR
ncbi:MAG: hypothetical protein QM523_08805 [Candidatus Pacebacteria bacterium]|nr:hypothetical protein [Candidatus Paceibacterota bacterium]